MSRKISKINFCMKEVSLFVVKNEIWRIRKIGKPLFCSSSHYQNKNLINMLCVQYVGFQFVFDWEIERLFTRSNKQLNAKIFIASSCFKWIIGASSLANFCISRKPLKDTLKTQKHRSDTKEEKMSGFTSSLSF